VANKKQQRKRAEAKTPAEDISSCLTKRDRSALIQTDEWSELRTHIAITEIVRADKKLSVFLEFQSAIRAAKS
jgi:hypothetical protein